MALNLAEHTDGSMSTTGVFVVALVVVSMMSGISLDFFGGPNDKNHNNLKKMIHLQVRQLLLILFKAF